MKRFAPFAFCLAALGCSSSSTDDSSPHDAAIDTMVDAAPEVAPEAGPDVVRDASCRLHKAYSSKNAACNACAEGACCDAVNGCFDDPRCDDDYVNCILACALFPDDAGADASDATGACLADCAAKYPAGKAEYDAAIACVDAACTDACR